MHRPAIAILAALSSAALLSSCGQNVDQTLEEMFDHTYPIEPTATFSITARDGSIRVYGAADGKNEVRVEAIKKAYSAERLKAISVRVSANHDSISVETAYAADPGGPFSDRSGTIDYVIVVPQSIRIAKLDLANGEVLLEDVRSVQASAHLGNGRLFAHNCFGNLDLSLDTGNLAIVYEWWDEQEFTIRTHVQDGNTFAYIPGDAAFHVIAHTATGRIGNDFQEQEDRRSEAVNKVDMLVNDGSKTTFQFETQDGNIRVSEHNP